MVLLLHEHVDMMQVPDKTSIRCRHRLSLLVFSHLISLLNMAALCCHRPERSQSPIPPTRLSTIDPIFTITALPDDHPHAVHIPRPPCVDQKLIRSPSIVSKLKSHLQRKGTSNSLKSQIYDADPGMLTSEEVLGFVERL